MNKSIIDFSDDEKFLTEWQLHVDAFEKSGITALPFLHADFIRDAAAYSGFTETEIAALLEVASEITRKEELHELFAFTVYHLQNSPIMSMYGNWPELQEQLGEWHTCFYLLAALSMIPGIRKNYRNAGIAEEIIRNTTLQFSGFYRNYVAGYQTPGIIKGQVFWLKNYRDRQLFRLGRMEYRVAELSWKGVLLRHRQSSRKLLLAPAGQRYNAAGLAIAAEAKDNTEWTAIFQENGATITGNIITPEGRAQKAPVSLSLTDWEIFVRSGDKIIDMHIPPGGGLSPEVCAASFRQAAEFFPAMMPEIKFKAIFCHSWIFNTQLEEKMPESNLAKFMREPYLIPVESERLSGIFFVFCRNGITDADLPSLPRDTSLRRAMLEILESGEDLRCAGMLYCLEDLKHFGTQYYRRNFQA